MAHFRAKFPGSAEKGKKGNHPGQGIKPGGLHKGGPSGKQEINRAKRHNKKHPKQTPWI